MNWDNWVIYALGAEYVNNRVTAFPSLSTQQKEDAMLLRAAWDNGRLVQIDGVGRTYLSQFRNHKIILLDKPYMEVTCSLFPSLQFISGSSNATLAHSDTPSTTFWITEK